MTIQNNLEEPITATSASDALLQYEGAKKAKKASGPGDSKKPKKAKKAKKAKRAKVADKEGRRTYKAKVNGLTLKSRMIRVSSELYDYLAKEAEDNRLTITEASRVLVEGLLK